MSLRSFTASALSPRKRADLDLRPARIHSTFRSRSSAFHVVTQEQAPTVSAGRQRCGKLPGTFHPLPAGQRRVRGATRRRLRRSGCESNASLSRHLQTDVSIERHLSRIRPCLTRSLARCFSRALRHLAFCFALRAPCGSGFPKKKSPCGCGPKNGRDFSSEPPQKARLRHLGAGHTRVASRRSVPSKNRANPNRRNCNGTLYQHRHS
jgi:hypothetical protein